VTTSQLILDRPASAPSRCNGAPILQKSVGQCSVAASQEVLRFEMPSVHTPARIQSIALLPWRASISVVEISILRI